MVALTGGRSHNSEAEGHWHRSVPTLWAVCSALEAGGGLTFTFCPVTWQAWPGPHTAQPSGLQCLWTKLNQEWASMLGHLSRVQEFCDPMDCSPPGSSVHGISQARIREWVAMPSSRGSSRTRDRTPSLLRQLHWGRFFTSSATQEVQEKRLFVGISFFYVLGKPEKATRVTTVQAWPWCDSQRKPSIPRKTRASVSSRTSKSLH